VTSELSTKSLGMGGLMLVLVWGLGACATTRDASDYGPSDPVRHPAECAAFAPLVRDVAAAAGVDPGLLAGIASVESGWKPRARSRAGARGLMQIMPSTGRRLDCGDLFSPADNLRCGARLLGRLLTRYDGAVDYALAAYALGAKAADRAYKRRDEAPRQRFIRRVMAARKDWLQHGCAS